MSEYEFWDELGNIFNAIVSYQQKTIEFNKRFVTPWITLGTVLDQNDHNAETLQAYKKAITIDEDNAANWLSLGDVHFKMGAFNDAASAYRKAIELNPNLGWAYANLALTCVTQQKYNEAVNLYVKSLEFITEDTDRAMIWNRLGNAYRKVNDYENAFIAFQMADECDSQNTGFKDQLDEVTVEQRVMPIVAEVYVNNKADNVVEKLAAPVEAIKDSVAETVESPEVTETTEASEEASATTESEKDIDGAVTKTVESPEVTETTEASDEASATTESEKAIDDAVTKTVESPEVTETTEASEVASATTESEKAIDGAVTKTIESPEATETAEASEVAPNGNEPEASVDNESVVEETTLAAEAKRTSEVSQPDESEQTPDILAEAETSTHEAVETSDVDSAENELIQSNEAIDAAPTEQSAEEQSVEENPTALDNEAYSEVKETTNTAEEQMETSSESETEITSGEDPAPTSATFAPITDAPESTTDNWLTFINATYGFQLKYPPQTQVLNNAPEKLVMNLPIATGTNLVEKYLEGIVTKGAGMSPSPLAIKSILSTSEIVVINGISFLKQTGGDAGAGHSHEWIAYSTSSDDTSVSLGFVFHCTNINNYDLPRSEFDREAEATVFEQMMSTFSWEASPSPSVSVPETETTTQEMEAEVEPVNIVESEEAVVDAPKPKIPVQEESADTTMTPVMPHAVETVTDISLLNQPVVLVVEDLNELINHTEQQTNTKVNDEEQTNQETVEKSSSMDVEDSLDDNNTAQPETSEVVNEAESAQETSEPAYEKFLADSPETAISSANDQSDVSQPAKSLKVEPDTKNAHVWNELGNVYFNTGSLEEAITAYSKAIDLDGLFAWPYSNLALVYVQKEKYAEAILLYQRSIELFSSDKDKAITWNRLGNVYRRLNNYDDAIACYQRADHLDPNNATRSLRSRFSLLGSLNIEQATSLAV